MTEILEITENNFAKVVNADRPILIDFWAAWCGPCQTMSSIIRILAMELEATLDFGKLNVDDVPVISKTLGIQSIPTFILFKNGDEIGRFHGAQPKSSLKNQILKKLKTIPE